jgi:hypothetical protein
MIDRVPINDIVERLDKEAEMKLWAGIYITGDTNIHPDLAAFLGDMISSLEYDRIVELGPHHGVLTRYLAIHCPETHIITIGPKNNHILTNITGFDNIEYHEYMEETPTNINMLIANYGLTKPLNAEVASCLLDLNKSGHRFIIIGFDEKMIHTFTNFDRFTKKWYKFDTVVFHID